jgi:hypothetical protein
MKNLKIRVPDAPLYTLFPRATGANPMPIALAEVYLALQNKAVEAQEHPLPTRVVPRRGGDVLPVGQAPRRQSVPWLEETDDAVQALR